MAIALVANAITSGVNGGTTSAIDTTGANFLRLAVCSFNAPVSPTLNDSNGNTWVPFNGGLLISGVGGNISYYYVANPTVGSGHTVTYTTAGSIFATVDFIALSDVVTSSPVEPTFTSNYSTTAGSIAPGSLTPVSDNAFLDLISGQGGSAPSVSCSDGLYSLIQFIPGDNATTVSGDSFYEVQTTATASNPTVQYAVQVAQTFAALIAIDGLAQPPPPVVPLMGQAIL